MPPRFAYWTIIIDDGPTAFRARDRAELAGVLRQLAHRNPNAVMKWFAHGKLWDSPEQERAAAREAARAQREPRGPDWRPGGTHEDPRARFRKPKGSGKRRQALMRGPGRKPWDRGKNRDNRGHPHPAPAGRHTGPFRAVEEPGPDPREMPGEPEPTAPPQPPGPERPPKPGHEPAPDTPQPETIRILPEPPERARHRRRRR